MPTLTLMDSDIYFAGKLLSSKDKPVVLDRLGSVRAWIDSQSSVEQTKYYPFGEERQITRNNQRKFGTYMRDDFSELDYAEQRYYSSALGRFITPDPYAGSVLLGNPDTWNRYAYVKNDPVNNADPHGLAPYHNISGGWVSPEQVPCPNVPEPGQVLTNGPAVYTRDVFYKESEGQYYQALLYSLDQDGDPVWYVPPSRNEIYITIHILPTPAYGPPPYNWYHYPYNPVPIPEAYFTKNFSINWSGWAPFGVGLVDGSKPRKDYWLYFGCEEPRYKGGAGTIINKQQSCESPNWYEGLY
jgi:RHS repeat-associated protein